jgi:hypothetical protein
MPIFNDLGFYPRGLGLMALKSNTKWTEEDDRRLLQLRSAGKSTRSIGLALRRSSSAIEGRLGVLKARARDKKLEQSTPINRDAVID